MVWAQSPGSCLVVNEPEPTVEKDSAESLHPVQDPEFVFKGFAATSYNLNFPRPLHSRNGVRGYALDDRKLKLDGLNLDFEYGLSGDDQIGFRLDTVLGGSYPRVDSAGGLFRNAYTGYTNTDFDIRQAFVRYTVDPDLFIDAGKFATHVGYEIMPGVDGKNPHGTPAYGYTFNPFTHTGVRVNYNVNEQLSVLGMVVMGADNFQDTNRSVSFGGQINWHPTSDFSLVFNVLDGPERADNDYDRRRYYDVVANYKVCEEVNLGLYAFTSTEEGLTPLRGTAWVNGLSFYIQTQLSDQFFLNFRQEFYNDPFGIRSGNPAHIRALTITPEYRITPEWAVRMDVRFDRSSTPIFETVGVPSTIRSRCSFSRP